MDPNPTPAQRAELDLHVEGYEHDPDAGDTWEQVRQEVLRDLAEDR